MDQGLGVRGWHFDFAQDDIAQCDRSQAFSLSHPLTFSFSHPPSVTPSLHLYSIQIFLTIVDLAVITFTIYIPVFGSFTSFIPLDAACVRINCPETL